MAADSGMKGKEARDAEDTVEDMGDSIVRSRAGSRSPYVGTLGI